MLEQFLEMLIATQGASKHTAENYLRDLRSLEKFTQKDLAKTTEKNLLNYFKTRSEHSPRTQARQLSTFKHFFRFLQQENIRKDNPTQSIDTPKIGKPLPKTLSQKDIQTLMDQCDDSPAGIRLKAILEILYASGLRVSELLSLKTTSLLKDQTALHVQGKGKKERIVPLHHHAKDAIETYLAIRGHFMKTKTNLLFPSPRTGDSLTRDGVFKMLKKHAINCGIDPTLISPHAFRHSFASHLLEGGANLRAVQDLLGHEDIATTEIYTHVLQDTLKKEIFTKHPLAKKNPLDS